MCTSHSHAWVATAQRPEHARVSACVDSATTDPAAVGSPYQQSTKHTARAAGPRFERAVRAPCCLPGARRWRRRRRRCSRRRRTRPAAHPWSTPTWASAPRTCTAPPPCSRRRLAYAGRQRGIRNHVLRTTAAGPRQMCCPCCLITTAVILGCHEQCQPSGQRWHH